MQPLLITVLALHVLSSVFWAGSTFALARTGGGEAGRLFLPQMGAAVVAASSGVLLWGLVHRGGFGSAEQLLAVGAAMAVAAFAIQAVGVGRVLLNDQPAASKLAVVYRISAALLLVTVVCMAVARYA